MTGALAVDDARPGGEALRPVFVIREAQFEALSLARQEDFELRMVDLLRDKYEAARAADEAALRHLVVEAQAAAEGYGLFAEEDIEPFVECRAVYGPEFPSGDDDEWAREVLDDASLDADDKSYRLAAQIAMLDQLAEPAEE